MKSKPIKKTGYNRYVYVTMYRCNYEHSVKLFVSLHSAGVYGHILLGGGGVFTAVLLPGNRRARRMRGWSKSLNGRFLCSLNFFTRSNVVTGSGQRSNLTLFTLSVAGTRPETEASKNPVKVLFKGITVPHKSRAHFKYRSRPDQTR